MDIIFKDVKDKKCVLFDTMTLENFTLDQLAVLWNEVRNRINKRVEEGKLN